MADIGLRLTGHYLDGGFPTATPGAFLTAAPIDFF
jgi:hypothetical protein